MRWKRCGARTWTRRFRRIAVPVLADQIGTIGGLLGCVGAKPDGSLGGGLHVEAISLRGIEREDRVQNAASFISIIAALPDLIATSKPPTWGSIRSM
jgi:hypothetical protein